MASLNRSCDFASPPVSCRNALCLEGSEVGCSGVGGLWNVTPPASRARGAINTTFKGGVA